ncbi:hypothetical protein OBBRIDRAFT_792171 [Obba rivulosa]|uniref:Uncharacterized protein n=1 Tax=Obba rivulosa TaxID=1052685 RepID=A0A8E2DNV0_9APHY|nr:hypothetical protein OBBRIDRAFT_792171 [Obba rivulosa]
MLYGTAVGNGLTRYSIQRKHLCGGVSATYYVHLYCGYAGAYHGEFANFLVQNGEAVARKHNVSLHELKHDECMVECIPGVSIQAARDPHT